MTNRKTLITMTDVRRLLNSYIISLIITFSIDRVFGYFTNEDYNYNYISFIGLTIFFLITIKMCGGFNVKPRRKFVNALSNVQRVPRK